MEPQKISALKLRLCSRWFLELSCLFVAEWAVKKGAVRQRATKNSRAELGGMGGSAGTPKVDKGFGDAAGFQIGPVWPNSRGSRGGLRQQGKWRFRERFLALQVGFEQIILHLTGSRLTANRRTDFDRAVGSGSPKLLIYRDNLIKER